MISATCYSDLPEKDIEVSELYGFPNFGNLFKFQELEFCMLYLASIKKLLNILFESLYGGFFLHLKILVTHFYSRRTNFFKMYLSNEFLK